MGRTFAVPRGAMTESWSLRHDSEFDNSPAIGEAYRRNGALRSSNMLRATEAVRIFGARSALIGGFVRDGGPVRPRRVLGTDAQTGRRTVNYKL